MTASTAITANDQAGSTMLIRMAEDVGFDRETAFAIGTDIPAAIERYRGLMRPLKQVDPSLRGDGTQRVVAALRGVGAKINPSLSEDQANAWVTSMVMALSDLPLRVILRAISRAMHDPIRFMGEVDETVRLRAKSILEAQRAALAKLESLLPRDQPALEAPPSERDTDTSKWGQIAEEEGAGWLMQKPEGEARPIGELRMPTRADYLEMGVDEATLDALASPKPPAETTATDEGETTNG